MPTRSAHTPARPASKIGVATRKVDEIVAELVMSSALVKSRTIDKTNMNPNDKAMVRCPVVNDLKNFMLAPPLN
jgi:hypothetical protein